MSNDRLSKSDWFLVRSVISETFSDSCRFFKCFSGRFSFNFRELFDTKAVFDFNSVVSILSLSFFFFLFTSLRLKIREEGWLHMLLRSCSFRSMLLLGGSGSVCPKIFSSMSASVSQLLSGAVSKSLFSLLFRLCLFAGSNRSLFNLCMTYFWYAAKTALIQLTLTRAAS